MKRMTTSLSFKALIILLLLQIPVIVTFLSGYMANKRHLDKLVHDSLAVVGRVYEGHIYGFLEMSRRRTRDFASDGYIRDRLDDIINGNLSAVRSLSDHLIKNKRPLDATIENIYVTVNQRVVASTDGDAIGTVPSGWSELYRDKKEGGIMEATLRESPSLIISSPVTHRVTGVHLGFIINSISMSELDRIMSGVFIRDLGAISLKTGRIRTLETYLVNRDKLMITGSIFLSDAILKQTVDTSPVDMCLQKNEEMHGTYTDYRGIDVIGISMCIPDMQWVLLTEIDVKEAFLTLRKMRAGAIIGGAIVIGLIAFIYLLFSRMVVKELRAVSKATQKIGDGLFDVKIPVRSSDVIGLISGAINDMSGKLAASDRTRKMLSAVIEATTDLVYTVDPAGRFLFVNESGRKMLGMDKDEDISGLRLLDCHPESACNTVFKIGFPAAEKNGTWSGENLLMSRHKGEIPVSQVIIAHKDDAGTLIFFSSIVRDMSEWKKAEAELMKLSMAIEHSINMVFITDTKGNIQYINSAFETMTGWSKDDVIGHNAEMLASSEIARTEYDEIWKSVSSGKTWHGVLKNTRKNGDLFWANVIVSPIKDEKGAVTHFLTVQEDISEKKQIEEKVQYLSLYDEMTGLINRGSFIELLSAWIYSHPKSESYAGVLLLLDIDNFKFINDTYGHHFGDELLRSLAGLLSSSVREFIEPGRESTLAENIICRMGGDEFAIFLPYLNQGEGFEIAERIRVRVEKFSIAEVPVHLTVSIGIVSYPEHGSTVKDILSRVDATMYRAKMDRNRSYIFQPEDRDLENIQTRLMQKEKIQEGIENDRFVPWFQPIMGINDNEIHHYEALARMNDGSGRTYLPRIFIGTAESFGLIRSIDRIIIEKTLIALSEIAGEGKKVSFCINLSAKHLGDKELMSFLRSRIAETGADPSRLIFEITETSAVSDMERAVRFIDELREIGCRFCLDDFGCGFTSFIYLREMKVDYVKIDGSFIRKITENVNDQLFVKAIVGVAKGMGIKTIAEFVETEEALRLLKEFGVDYAQGYLIGKPGPHI